MDADLLRHLTDDERAFLASIQRPIPGCRISMSMDRDTVIGLLTALATARAQAATRHSEVSSTESTWVDLCPYHDSMLADAYRRGVEDAAKVADHYADESGYAYEIADEIRALATKEGR